MSASVPPTTQGCCDGGCKTRPMKPVGGRAGLHPPHKPVPAGRHTCAGREGATSFRSACGLSDCWLHPEQAHCTSMADPSGPMHQVHEKGPPPLQLQPTRPVHTQLQPAHVVELDHQWAPGTSITRLSGQVLIIQPCVEECEMAPQLRNAQNTAGPLLSTL
jgi:hypothetical protein